MIVFWLAIAMALVGAAASLVGPRVRPAGDADLVTREAELVDGFYGAQPLVAGPRVAEPLAGQSTVDDPRAVPDLR